MSAKMFLTSCDVASIGEHKTSTQQKMQEMHQSMANPKERKTRRKENLALMIFNAFIPTSLEILFSNLGGASVNQCEIDLRLVDIRIVSIQYITVIGNTQRKNMQDPCLER